MAEDIWETEWRYSGIPGIGDYVQIGGTSVRTGEWATREGIIAGYTTTIFGEVSWFVGERRKADNGGFHVEKWRKAVLPEVPPMKIAQQRMMK